MVDGSFCGDGSGQPQFDSLHTYRHNVINNSECRFVEENSVDEPKYLRSEEIRIYKIEKKRRRKNFKENIDVILLALTTEKVKGIF